MGLTERSFGELTAFTARDVHPPVYYYFVKMVRGIVQGGNGIVIGKLCSLLPLAGLFAYAATMVRRRFGWLCAGLFAFGIMVSPIVNNSSYHIPSAKQSLADRTSIPQAAAKKAIPNQSSYVRRFMPTSTPPPGGTNHQWEERRISGVLRCEERFATRTLEVLGEAPTGASLNC